MDGGGAGKADDPAHSGVPWAVSRHAWPPRIGDPQTGELLLEEDLDLIASLGARYVRTDLWWYVIEPQMGVFDHSALDFYRRMIEKAAARSMVQRLEGNKKAAADALGISRSRLYRLLE